MPLKPLEPEDYPFFDYRRFTFSLGIETPEGIWLSGSTAVHHDPERNVMLIDGDLVAQADVIFEKMRLALVPAGRGLRDLTRVVRYVTPAALPDLARLDAHQADVLGTPDVSTIVVARLLRKNALIEMEAAIVPAQRGLSILMPDTVEDPAAEIERAVADRPVLRFAQFATPGHAPLPDRPGLKVTSPSLPDGAAGLHAEAILAAPEAGIVHVSVQGRPEAGGITEQCRDAYRRLTETLEAAQSGMDQVIKTTEFIAPEGLADYRETAAVRREVFAPPYPAATGVVCQGFADDGTLIAIEATARRKDAP